MLFLDGGTNVYRHLVSLSVNGGHMMTHLLHLAPYGATGMKLKNYILEMIPGCILTNPCQINPPHSIKTASTTAAHSIANWWIVGMGLLRYNQVSFPRYNF